VIVDCRFQFGHRVRLVLVGLTEVRRREVGACLFVPRCLQPPHEVDVLVQVRDAEPATPTADRSVAQPAQQQASPSGPMSEVSGRLLR